MRIAGLTIRNFKCIGDPGCAISIDKIVVLVGPNNSGKSTVLDAYEAFASSGKELDAADFHKEQTQLPVEITGAFVEITEEDESLIGKKWSHDDPDYGKCVKVRWRWDKPGTKGQKQSFNPQTKVFEDGGAGGWDSLLASVIPQPVRIRPTDAPATTQDKLVGLLKDHVKAHLKADAQSTKAAFDKMEELAQQVFAGAKAEFDDVALRISTNVSQMFPGTAVELVPRSKNAIDEKLVAADSYLRISTEGRSPAPLGSQGTGLQRALLWSALSVLTGGGKKKAKVAAGGSRILLIDEPEAFLHPPTVRDARETLYTFALEAPEWQVIATTHSPVFIDVSKEHTTIVRVDATATAKHFFSTDRASFDAEERERLRMVRACDPSVCEFFFYDRVVLVEGPTEQIAVLHAADKLGLRVHVIDCRGKANIPLFARILNHFQLPYTVIHDSDRPKASRQGKLIANGMWTLNSTIRDVVMASGMGRTFVQFPHFEGEFLHDDLASGKVDRVLEVLADPSTNDYQRVMDAYKPLLSDGSGSLTTDAASFDAKHCAYLSQTGLTNDPLWV